MDTATLGPAPTVASQRLTLVVMWSRAEPGRVGEALVLDRNERGEGQLLGRGPARDSDPVPRARLVRQRPGADLPRPPIASPGISREQLLLRVRGGRVEVDNRGRRRLRVGGAVVERATLAPGELLELENELLLRVERRRSPMAPAPDWPETPRVSFGDADAFGIVGESPRAWELRNELAFVARRPMHTLLLGPSGSGKELAARAVHALAGGRGPWVARNAATLPEGLVEAELFGNVQDYPNPGMKARAGIVGAADGGALFLDEIGELPQAQQARLLRVLDAEGEYHRLGEDRARTSRFRLIAATNRSVASIKHDLVGRMAARIELPPLAERRSDIPLLMAHLIRTMVRSDPSLARFLDEAGAVRFRPDLVRQLLQAPLELGVRSLSQHLWESVRRAEGDWLGPLPTRVASAEPEPVVREITPEAIRAALEAHDGVVSRAYRALGLPSRHVLHRLMRKHGIER